MYLCLLSSMFFTALTGLDLTSKPINPIPSCCDNLFYGVVSLNFALGRGISVSELPGGYEYPIPPRVLYKLLTDRPDNYTPTNGRAPLFMVTYGFLTWLFSFNMAKAMLWYVLIGTFFMMLFVFLILQEATKSLLAPLLAQFLMWFYRPSGFWFAFMTLPSNLLILTTCYFTAQVIRSDKQTFALVAGLSASLLVLTRFQWSLFICLLTFHLGFLFLKRKIKRNQLTCFLIPLIILNFGWMVRNRIQLGYWEHTPRSAYNFLCRVADNGRAKEVPWRKPETINYIKETLQADVPYSLTSPALERYYLKCAFKILNSNGYENYKNYIFSTFEYLFNIWSFKFDSSIKKEIFPDFRSGFFNKVFTKLKYPAFIFIGIFNRIASFWFFAGLIYLIACKKSPRISALKILGAATFYFSMTMALFSNIWHYMNMTVIGIWCMVGFSFYLFYQKIFQAATSRNIS